MKLKAKKRDVLHCAIRLHELRALAVEPMEHAESDTSGAAIFFGVSLFFVIFHSIFL